MVPSLLRAALELTAQAIPCFPCADDKSPTTPHGFKDATCNPDEVRRLWHLYPGELIGVPTGEASGLAVLDIDPCNGGDPWFETHRERLLPTRIHETRSGGQHLVFKSAAGLRCSASKIAAGVDVRATGGYVIWWPSAGLFVPCTGPISPWPEWLREKPSAQRQASYARTIILDRCTLNRLIRFVAMAEPGQRNTKTYWAGCRVGEMAASGQLDATEGAAILAEAATRAGLERDEAERTAWNGIRRSFHDA